MNNDDGAPGRPADSARLTDFGHERVSAAEKTVRVEGVFRQVADRYDLMNDLMSLGAHRIMKRIAVEMTALRPGDTALDLAGGTGDLAALLSPIVADTGRVLLADINANMLGVGRDRLLDRGMNNVAAIQANAEALPLPTSSVDCATIGFGLRNFTDKRRALDEIHRVLKPGGAIVVIEFSKPSHSAVRSAYGLFQATWPIMGQLVVGDAAPYRYLVDSIKVHPDQAALKLMLEDAGFSDVKVDNLFDGIVAIHRGTK